MKLVALVSVIYDSEDVMKKDWVDAEKGLDISYARRIPDLFDEAAAEYALRLRDAWKTKIAETELICLLRGNVPESLVKNLFAVGFDRLVLLPGEPGMDAATTATLAADWIRSDNGCDLLFLGQMDSVSCDLSLPGRLAAQLEMPCTGYIADLTPTETGLQIRRRYSGGWFCAESEPRGVFAFYNAEHSFLRLATLREKMAVSGKMPEKIFCASVPNGDAKVRLIGLRSALQERRCSFLEPENIETAAKQVLGWMLEEGPQDV